MRAVVHDTYGSPDVLRIESVARPVPNDDEVLVRVHAVTVSRTDCGFRSARPLFIRLFTGIRGPKRRVLGAEFAGDVEAVGAAVAEFRPGDRVFGTTAGFGAHAEFVCMRESARIANLPAGMTYDAGAAICDGGLKALTSLARANVGPGRRVLVYGASGAIGTAAVQLAKHLGAHVTAVTETKNLELVRSLGADNVIDYTREDFTKNRETYDVVYDAVGKHSFLRCRRSLAPGGIYVATDGFANLLAGLWTRWIGEKKVLFLLPRATKQDVVFLKELVERGEFRAVVDRTYAFEDVVDATAYVETGTKTGNVILTIDGDESLA